MGETIYGYVRVFTQDQNEARQLAAMRKFGVPEENVVVEKLSGKDFNRPRYQRLVRALRREDVLVVKSIDRLGRNYTEILDQWSFITKKREAAIVVLDMPLLDTRQSRDLTGTLMEGIRRNEQKGDGLFLYRLGRSGEDHYRRAVLPAAEGEKSGRYFDRR